MRFYLGGAALDALGACGRAVKPLRARGQDALPGMDGGGVGARMMCGVRG
jgi:hypothetical protein